MILYFFSPASPSYMKLENILQKDNSAIQYFKNFECTKINIEKEQYKNLVQRYNIGQTPIFIHVDKSGNPQKMTLFSLHDTWKLLSQKLER